MYYYTVNTVSFYLYLEFSHFLMIEIFHFLGIRLNLNYIKQYLMFVLLEINI